MCNLGSVTGGGCPPLLLAFREDPLHLEACILDGGRVQFNTRQSGWFLPEMQFFFPLGSDHSKPQKAVFSDHQ